MRVGEWPSQDIAPASYHFLIKWERAGYRGFKSHLARYEKGDIYGIPDFAISSPFCNKVGDARHDRRRQYHHQQIRKKGGSYPSFSFFCTIILYPYFDNSCYHKSRINVYKIFY